MKQYTHLPTGKIFQQVVLNGDSLDDFKELHTHANYQIPYWMVKGNDWEEIKEKEWEVLSFLNKQTNCISTLRQNGMYLDSIVSGNGILAFENVDLNYWLIHSVKRLNDNKIFTIREKYIDVFNFKRELGRFHISEGKMLISNGDNIFVSNITTISKTKELLFTTEDGVDVFAGDSPWFTLSDIQCKGFNSLVMQFKNITGEATKTVYKYFSTKEAAEEYVLINRPCLSIKDVAFIYTSAMGNSRKNNIGVTYFEKLKKLVNSKS